jgi:hypothetical protein
LVDRELALGMLTKETTLEPFVACCARLFDQHQNAISVAIDSHLDHLLPMSAFLSFAPQSISRSAKVRGKSRFYGFQVRFPIHPREHEDLFG